MRHKTPSTQPVQLALTVEGMLWLCLVVLAVSVLVSTASSDFPGHTRAMLGEGVVVASSAALGAFALRHATREARPGLRPWVGVAVRLAILGPALLFLLVAAAAGFAA
ncbi:MAG: hypothetical protein KUG77_15255 [Nannocystaceae bacterium]|nr:hypothetical protein [Nannocystaceae bacterium]